MAEKPILFSAPMVRAILDGLKTQTRRVIKPQPIENGIRYDAELGDIICRDDDFAPSEFLWKGKPRVNWPAFCPYGQPGDLLWVRETWSLVDPNDPTHIGPPEIPHWHPVPGDTCLGACWDPVYRADRGDTPANGWRPSIFMPKWVCRLKPPITDVRVERLQEISEEDCLAEGIRKWTPEGDDAVVCGSAPAYARPDRGDFLGGWSARNAFKGLWDSINAKPKPIKQDGAIVSYVSYPWEDINEMREHRGKPWKVVGNPGLWVITFEGPSQ